MDLASGLKAESFRALTRTIVPGSIAVGPYILIAATYYPSVIGKFFDEHAYAFVAVVVVMILSAGVILEDVGTCIEAWVWDPLLDARDSTHYDNWYAYLQLRLGNELVGQRYLRTIVDKLKFELSMIPAILLFLVGMLWLDHLVTIFTATSESFFVVITVALIAYMLWESHDSARVLSKTRKLILEVVPRKKNGDAGDATLDSIFLAVKSQSDLKPVD